jgi:hypothetical protein
MDHLKVELSDHYDIQEKGEIHFFNLIDVNYHPEASALGFYYQYRNLVIASLKKKGYKVMWQNNMVLPADEELSPTFEEMILAIVLRLISPHLPRLVRDNYMHCIGESKGLMDYRTDILIKVPNFLAEIESSEMSKNGGDHLAR